jgi:DNA-binding CsgD family transcriptional regulator
MVKDGCKICNSEHKDYAERMILQGYTKWRIAKSLKAMGLDITYASVNRHKTNHMAEYADQIKELSTPKTGIVQERIVGEICVIDVLEKALKTKNSVRKFRKISEHVSDILIKQVNIVLDLQDKFMRGAGKYPHEEIRGLSIINDVLIKFEMFINNMPDTLPLTIVNKTLTERANDIQQSVIDGKINNDLANRLLNNLGLCAKIIEIDDLIKRIEVLEGES